jgi:hypothetical protein
VLLWISTSYIKGNEEIKKHLNPKVFSRAWHWWLTPIILATKEAEIKRITV